MNIRPANKADAIHLAELINLAGEGIPYFLWQKAAQGSESPLDVGIKRASRDTGDFSYRNVVIAEDNPEICGMILSYAIPEQYDLSGINELPSLIQPLVLLEAQATGSWYINAIATYDMYRQKGIASLLLDEIELHAKIAGYSQCSLIVSELNQRAIHLYQNRGYFIKTREPALLMSKQEPAYDWLLMIKSL